MGLHVLQWCHPILACAMRTSYFTRITTLYGAWKVDSGPCRFVRKPELRHQYGMLFNHHGQVISGLKNMDLFLSIDLPKVEDIAHVPPPFPECDNWAAAHRTNQNQHVYYSSLGFGRNNHRPMTELNSNTSEYLAEAIHITVCNQYKNKYVKLLK